MNDLISKQAAIEAVHKSILNFFDINDDEESPMTYKDKQLLEINKAITTRIKALPSAQPETCKGCKHLDKWENEVEYGYPSPCTRCKRRAEDNYER